MRTGVAGTGVLIEFDLLIELVDFVANVVYHRGTFLDGSHVTGSCGLPFALNGLEDEIPSGSVAHDTTCQTRRGGVAGY
jgi:hypothetical protein